MGHLKLLWDQDIQAMITHRKIKEKFTKRLQIMLVSKWWYSKQCSHWIYPRYFAFKVVFGEIVIARTETKCDINFDW